jgi:O-glycosyl hydrolase
MKNSPSKILIGVFIALLLVGPSSAQQNVTVDLNIEKQTIRGFGGMTHRVWTGYDLNDSDRDLAFGNGPGQMGLTVLRIWISDNESQWPLEVASAKNVVDRGGIVYASPWNPPAALRTPYTLVRWGTSYQTHKIAPSNYTAYVNHLNKFVKYMKDNGVPLYAISFQNEPDWCDAWTCWSETEVYNFVKSHAADLRLHGTKVITAESFAYGKSYYDQIIDDATALLNIDIIGAHFYGSTAASGDNFFQYPKADEKAAHKERWMTEHYTDSKGNANMWRGYIITGDQDQTPKYDTVRALDVGYEIHRGLVEGNFNQYTWWYIRRNYGLIMNDTQNNVQPNAASAAEVGKVTKRGYVMAQYSKFVRPGFVRVEATKNPATGVYVSAYKKADSVVVVVVNRAAQRSLNISIPGATAIQSWKKYTTSASKNIADDGSITATNGAFSTSFDQESITTLVGVGPSAPPEPRAPYDGVIQIPGTIEAENYDKGGEGVAYHDEDVANSGNMYRTDGVDIDANDADGYAVGWTVAGEWLEYTVDVTESGTYQWEARVATGADNAAFKLLLDGVDISGSVAVTSTGDWKTFTTLSGSTPALTTGQKVLRLEIEGSYVNIDWIRISTDPGPVAQIGFQNSVSSDLTYSVYNIIGEFIGTIDLNQSIDKYSQLRLLTQRPGIYLLKSAKNSRVETVQLRDGAGIH